MDGPGATGRDDDDEQENYRNPAANGFLWPNAHHAPRTAPPTNVASHDGHFHPPVVEQQHGGMNGGPAEWVAPAPLCNDDAFPWENNQDYRTSGSEADTDIWDVNPPSATQPWHVGAGLMSSDDAMYAGSDRSDLGGSFDGYGSSGDSSLSDSASTSGDGYSSDEAAVTFWGGSGSVDVSSSLGGSSTSVASSNGWGSHAPGSHVGDVEYAAAWEPPELPLSAPHPPPPAQQFMASAVAMPVALAPAPAPPDGPIDGAFGGGAKRAAAPAPARIKSEPPPPPDVCPFCKDAAPGDGDDGASGDSAGITRVRRKRVKPRGRMKVGLWWKAHGYSGPRYCQRCSELFRDHLIRQLSNSANCSRDKPCPDCTKILTHFKGAASDVWSSIEAREETNWTKRRLREAASSSQPKKVKLAAGMAAIGLRSGRSGAVGREPESGAAERLVEPER